MASSERFNLDIHMCMHIQHTQVNSTLREIHLSKHGMTDTGVEWICRMLKGNKTLMLLNLGW